MACALCSRLNCNYLKNYENKQAKSSYQQKPNIDLVNKIYDEAIVISTCSTFYLDKEGGLRGYRWYQLIGRISVWFTNEESKHQTDLYICEIFESILSIRNVYTVGHVWSISPLTIQLKIEDRTSICYYTTIADNVLNHYRDRNSQVSILAEQVRHERSNGFYYNPTTEEYFLPPSIQHDGLFTYLSRAKQIAFDEAQLIDNKVQNVKGTPWEGKTTWESTI